MKKSYIRKRSKKMERQLYRERKLRDELMNRCKGYCEICGNWPDWRGLAKHEKKKRSQGGDPLDPENCVMVCGKCHSATEGIKEV